VAGGGVTAVIVLVDERRRDLACKAVREAPEGYVVKIDEATRTLQQNAAMWPSLRDISRQVLWHGEQLCEEDWKDILSAALNGQRTVPGIDGRLVVLGQRTSKLKKSPFGDLLDLIGAFGADHDVEWSREAAEEFARQKAVAHADPA
jgi:hypothetical protein